MKLIAWPKNKYIKKKGQNINIAKLKAGGQSVENL